MRLTANLHLSPLEQQIIHDADRILAKNSLLSKVVDMMAGLSERQHAYIIRKNIWQELPVTTPKISKGEQYGGLPYVVLDFPRIFSKQDVFAIRTMFWWGKYFSVTLHLKGQFLHKYVSGIQRKLGADTTNSLRLSTGGAEWMHDLDAANWQLATPDSLINSFDFSFLKIAQKIDFSIEQPVEDMLFSGYMTMLDMPD